MKKNELNGKMLNPDKVRNSELLFNPDFYKLVVGISVGELPQIEKPYRDFMNSMVSPIKKECRRYINEILDSSINPEVVTEFKELEGAMVNKTETERQIRVLESQIKMLKASDNMDNLMEAIKLESRVMELNKELKEIKERFYILYSKAVRDSEPLSKDILKMITSVRESVRDYNDLIDGRLHQIEVERKLLADIKDSIGRTCLDMIDDTLRQRVGISESRISKGISEGKGLLQLAVEGAK